MAERAVTTCEQCGQADDHPKVHIGPVTKHHDCLSVAEDAMVRESTPAAASIIDACKDGLRGPDLLAHIQEHHGEAGASKKGSRR